MPWLRRAALGVVLLAGPGCAAMLPRLQPPQLTVSALAIGSGSLQQPPIRLTLHATNPNDRAITIRDIQCNLELAGAPFAQGATEAAFTLPALGATDFTLNVSAQLDQVLSALAAAVGRHSVDYRLYGQVRLQGGLLRSIPFDQKGRVRL